MFARRCVLVCALFGILAAVGGALAVASGSSAAVARRSIAISRSGVVRATKHRVVGRAGTPTIHLRGFRDFDLGPARLGTGNRSHGNQTRLDSTPKMQASKETAAATRGRSTTDPAPALRSLGRLREIPSLRTVDSDTFESASGVYVAHVYTDAVNYRASNGKFEAINDRLTHAGQVLVDRADADHVRLPIRLNRAVSISEGGSAVRLTLVGASRSRASVAGSVARYAKAFPGTTVALQAVPGSLEFSFKLANPGAHRLFKIGLSVPHGWHARLRQRSLSLVNSHGKARFEIPMPLMLEHARHGMAPSYAGASQVRVSLSRHRGGQLTLTYAISRSWLTSQRRSFPIVLDPDVTPSLSTGEDCTIYSNALGSSGAADCGTGASYDVVGAGETAPEDDIGSYVTSGSYVTMMNFPADPGGIPADSEVLGATLSMTAESLDSTASSVNFSVLPMSDSFTAAEATWEYSDLATGDKWQCPGGDYEGCQSGTPSTVAASGAFTQTGTPTTVSLTALAQAWVDGSQPAWELGSQKYVPLMLYPTSTGNYAEIYRAGSGGSTEPQLTIYYTPRLGADPGSTIPSTGLDDNTSLGVDVANGDVQVQRSDLSVPGIAGMPLGLSHSYNSESSSGGWSLDQPPSLSPETGVSDAQVLTQPDGNTSVWAAAPSSTWGEGGTYTPPAGVNGSLCEALPNGNPASAVGYGNTPYVFYIGSDGQLHGDYLDSTLNIWVPMNIAAQTGAPASISTAAPNTSPTVVIEEGSAPPATGSDSDQINLYYVDSNHEIAQWYFNGSTWADKQLGGTVAPNTSPSAVQNSSGNQFVYYHDTDGKIDQLNYVSSWSNSEISYGSIAPNTSPAATIDSSGYVHLFYVDNSTGTDEIGESWMYGSWYNQLLGGTVAPNTSPAAINNSSNDYFVFYTGSNDEISEYYYLGSGSWTSTVPGGTVAPNTSPTAVFDSGGSPHVFYTGGDQHFAQFYIAYGGLTGTWESEDPLSVSVAPNTNPMAPTYLSGGTLSPFYVGSDGQIHEMLWNGSAWNDQPMGGTVGVGTCKPQYSGAIWELTYYDTGERLDFNFAGQLIAAYDRNGNPIQYTYYTSGTDDGLVETVTDTEGRTFSYTYWSGTTELDRITDNATGRYVQFNWTSGQLTSDEDADGNTTDYSYTSGLLTQITDPSGNETSISYPTPTGGELLQINVTRPSAMTSPTTETTQYAYYAQGTPPPAGKQTCGGSPSGELPYGYTIVTLPDGNWREYCYDTHDRVYETFDEATQQPTTTTYDANDDVTQVVAPTNTQFGSPTVITSTTFDACFRQIAQTTGTGTGAPTSTQGYVDPATSTCTATSPTEYLPTSSTPPAGTRGIATTQRYVYDGNGNLTRITDGLATQNTLEFDYNANGTLADSYDADGQKTSYAYTYCAASGSSCASTWPEALYSVTTTPPTPLAATTSYYNLAGLVSSSDDGDSNTTSYTYDDNDNLHVETYQGGATTTNTYDDDGNLTSSVDSQTGTTSYTFWPDNQLKTESNPGAAGQSATSTSYAYNGNGDMSSATDAGGAVSYSYDNDDRVNSITQPGISTPFTFTYDNDGRLVCTSYPNGMVVQQLYDAYNNLTSIQAANGSASCNQASPTGTPAGTVFQNDAYSYAAGSNLAQTEMITTSSSTTGWNYYYDPLNRLLEAAGGTGGTYNYSYDGDGNLLTRTTNPSTGAIQTATYNDANELSSLTGGSSSSGCGTGGTYTQSYDSAGNLTCLGNSAGTTSLGYNVREQTTSLNPFAAGSQALSYQGDGQNNPAQIGNQPSGGAAPALQENMLGISAQEPSSSSGATASTSDTYYTRAPDGTLLSERTPSADYYYVEDANGSVVALTNSSDTVANTYTYDPFGTITSSTGSAPNSFGFDGGYNAQAGLVLFGTRYYNPSTATWTQPDPDVESLATDPTQADPYSFAADNPLNENDSSGTSVSPSGSEWNQYTAEASQYCDAHKNGSFHNILDGGPSLTCAVIRKDYRPTHYPSSDNGLYCAAGVLAAPFAYAVSFPEDVASAAIAGGGGGLSGVAIREAAKLGTVAGC